jgi:hypothetical protein
MEQPTQFYALGLVMVLLGDDSAWSVNLAWAYVVVRMIHSIIYSAYNNISLRSQSVCTSDAEFRTALMVSWDSLQSAP